MNDFDGNGDFLDFGEKVWFFSCKVKNVVVGKVCIKLDDIYYFFFCLGDNNVIIFDKNIFIC